MAASSSSAAASTARSGRSSTVGSGVGSGSSPTGSGTPGCGTAGSDAAGSDAAATASAAAARSLRGLRLDFAASDSGFAALPGAETAGMPTNVSYSPGPVSSVCNEDANSVSSRAPISSIMPPRP